jgi:hypothetical protein
MTMIPYVCLLILIMANGGGASFSCPPDVRWGARTTIITTTKAASLTRCSVFIKKDPCPSSSTQESFDDEFELPVKRWACPEHSDVCEETGVTLSRYMAEIARANPGELDDIGSIFTSIQTAAKTISKLVRQSSLTGITGLEGGGGSINIQGEEQKKLDVIANDVLKKAIKWTGILGTLLASEEDDTPVMVDNMGRRVYSNDIVLEQEGDYVAVFDPLDGFSNVDANIPTVCGLDKGRNL